MERIILLVCLVFALPAMSEPNYLKHSTTINSSIPILQRPEHATDKEEHDGGSDFICVPSDLGGYQPQRAPHGVNKKGFPPLGRKGVSKEECLRSVDNARNGVVCSHTLLGWKPTHFSGFVESRKTLGKENHGFYGVSIEGPKALETCIKATRFSTREKLCFWNGDSWLIGLVSGKTGAGGGRFKTLDTCLDAINPSWRQTALQSNLRSNSFHTVGLFSLFDSNQNGTTHSSWSPSSCNNCHDSTKYPIPDWAMSPEAFDKKLQDPKTAKEAQTWLGKLNNHLNVLRDMPPSISERENLHSSQGGKQYLNFLKDRYTSLNPVVPPLPKEPNSPDHTSSKEIQILSSKTLGHYRAMLPEVLDPEIDSILKDENTFFYDESSLPSGYQDASKSVVGVRKSGDSTFVKGAPFIDTSTKKLKVFSHGVGIDPHSSVKVFHFIRRPQRTDGTFETIKLKKTRGSDYREDGETWNWEFPVGTVSGEVLYSLDSSGEPHVLEVRTRKKSANGKNEWESNIFRPFNAEADLLLALEELKKSETFAEESHKIIETIKETPIESVRIGSQGFQVPGLSFKGWTQKLPKMSEPLVEKLLDRPFQSSLGAVWKKDDEREAYGATTEQQFGLVPQHGKTGALRVDTESCNSCHQYTNRPLGYLYPDRFGQLDNLLRNTTDAYGNTGGNDGQFRWHPFDPAFMDKFSQIPDNRRIRPEFKSWIEFVK